ncbi:MAG: hypothetical protein WBW51_06540 [Methyloceanibacter sp.]
MIEGLISVVTPAGQAPVSESASDETIDSVALAGAEAIQRIIADRNALRSCTSLQQRDLAALNSANQELRRRLGLIRHHYVELATRILTQLEQFDQATREATRDLSHATPSGANDDDKLAALANRLKPANMTSKPVEEGASPAR